MQGFNRCIVAGNLTRDPELRYTPSGAAIAAFGLAVNRSWKDDTGQKKEEVTFIDVTAFGKQGEIIAQYLKKGRPILIEGRLRTESWTDKTTQAKRSKLTVVLETFTFLDSGGGGQSEQRPAAKPDSDPDAQPREDEVPF